MSNEIIKDAEKHMEKALEVLRIELSKLRTGRAHTSLVDNIKVDYYGTATPLNHVASVTVSDARTISISPWEKTMLKPIEKAIQNADLGLNPIPDVNSIRIPIPPLTEERRKELVKVVKATAEQSRVAIRNVRREAITELKDLLKEKLVDEDSEHRAEENIQKVTDKFIAEVEKIALAKETELMKV